MVGRWKYPEGNSRKGKKGRGGPNLGRPDHITPKERRVLDRYFLNGFNKKEAMEFAGYGSAATNTYNFFNRPIVKREIAERRERAREKFEITEDKVLQELAAIAFARLSNVLAIQEDGSAVIDLNDMGEAERAAISEFVVDEYKDGKGEDARDVKKVKVKFHDKAGALEKIMRHLGMFKDKVELGADADLVAILMEGRKQASTTKE